MKTIECVRTIKVGKQVMLVTSLTYCPRVLGSTVTINFSDTSKHEFLVADAPDWVRKAIGLN